MNLNFKVFGEGFPVVILHGLFGSLDNWQTLARKMGQHFRIFIIDQRNHGKSPHTADHTYELMANDLKEFLDQNGISKAHVIGHSMGGKTAMEFAILYPNRLEKLIIVDMATKSYGNGHDEIFKALFDLNLDSISKREEADERLKSAIPDFSVRQFLLKNLQRSDNGKFSWKMNLTGLFSNYDKINEEIQAEQPVMNETLLVKGGKSDYVSQEDIQKLEKIFPNTSVVTIPDAGHWVHAEQPQQFLEAVMKFLDN